MVGNRELFHSYFKREIETGACFIVISSFSRTTNILSTKLTTHNRFSIPESKIYDTLACVALRAAPMLLKHLARRIFYLIRRDNDKIALNGELILYIFHDLYVYMLTCFSILAC